MRKRIKTIGCLILVLMIIYAQQAMPSYAGDKAVGKITTRREGEAISSGGTRKNAVKIEKVRKSEEIREPESGSDSEPSPEPTPEPEPSPKT